MSTFGVDKNGMPVLLADVPNAGVSRKAAGQKSGNPQHDVRSGKFGAGGGGGKKKATPPANVDPLEFARMLDAVRQAARLFQGEITPENIESFIKEHAKNPAAVNLQQFAQLVNEQHVADIVDIIDGSTRGGDKTIKLTAPRSYVKKALASLDDASVAEVQHRLEERGNSPTTIEKFINKKVSPDRHEAIQEHKKARAGTT